LIEIIDQVVPVNFPVRLSGFAQVKPDVYHSDEAFEMPVPH